MSHTSTDSAEAANGYHGPFSRAATPPSAAPPHATSPHATSPHDSADPAATSPLRTDADALRELTRLIFSVGFRVDEVRRRWPAFEAAFSGFEPAVVGALDPSALSLLLANPGLIRNRNKLAATMANARTLVRLAEVYGSFSAVLDALASEVYERRTEFIQSTFTHVGPVTAYAFLRLAGLADESDHPHHQ